MDRLAGIGDDGIAQNAQLAGIAIDLQVMAAPLGAQWSMPLNADSFTIGGTL